MGHRVKGEKGWQCVVGPPRLALKREIIFIYWCVTVCVCVYVCVCGRVKKRGMKEGVLLCKGNQ